MKRADEFIRDKELEYKQLWEDWNRKEKMAAFKDYADQQLRLHVVGVPKGTLCDVSDCTNPKLEGSELCVQHKFIGE